MKLHEFIEDNSGGLSAMRLAFLTWTLGVFLLWMMISIQTRALQPLPDSLIITMIGFSGMKAVQRFGEKSVETTT